MLLAQQEPIGAVGAWALMLGVGLLLFGAGALVASIARRTADGRIGVNGLAGIRTQTTRSSPQAWQAAHEAGLASTVFGGRAMQVSAVVAPIAGVLLGQTDWDRVVMSWSIAIGLGIALSVSLVIYGAILGQRAARDVLAHDE